jgi:general secretion pathway protein L
VLAADGKSARVWRRGRFAELREGAQARVQGADLGLHPDMVLEREAVLPALSLPDLRRLVTNDLDRLTPFRADEVYLDIAPIGPEPAPGRRTVRLAVIPRADAEAALEAARRCGVAPRRIGVTGSPDHALRYDFAPALRAAGRGGRADRAPLYWWGAALALIAVNLAVLVARDMNDVGALRRTVEAQRPVVELALKLRQRVDGETAARAALVQRRGQNEPLRILDGAARALPPPQWVQRLEWNGRLVRLSGFRDPGFDVLAAARASAVMARPRTLNGGEATPGAARPAFDLVAEPAQSARSQSVGPRPGGRQ